MGDIQDSLARGVRDIAETGTLEHIRYRSARDAGGRGDVRTADFFNSRHKSHRTTLK